MSAKPRTTPKDLVLSVPLARRPGAKARGLPRTVLAVRIPLGFSAISRTCWRRECPPVLCLNLLWKRDKFLSRAAEPTFEPIFSSGIVLLGGSLAPMPASSDHLVDLEQQLAGLLVQFEFLSEAWPMAPRAVDRASIGRERSQTLDKIGSLQHRITVTRAETLADAAVQLRRLEAIVDTGAMVSD